MTAAGYLDVKSVEYFSYYCVALLLPYGRVILSIAGKYESIFANGISI